MVSTTPSLDTDEISSVADYLIAQEEKILQKWEDQLNVKSDQPSSLVSLSQTEFYNSIPDFLENICSVLRKGENWLEEISRTHGRQRWEYGFDLRMVTEEWGNLFLIIMNQVNTYQKAHPLSSDTYKIIQKRLAKFIHEAIKNSVDEYFRLQKLKAQTQMEDLEEIIREKEGVNESRGKNLQQASHDVGGSMVVVKMNIALLKDLDLSDEAREIVDELSLAADNLSQLLNNLLELFRLEAGREQLEIEEFDASEVLSDLASNMKSLAKAKGLEIHVEDNGKLPVQGDKLKVKRIAQNLMLNSLKYTEKGQVRISWKEEPDDHWMLTVEDTGPGIDSTNAALFTDKEGNENPSKSIHSNQNHGPKEVKMHSEGIGLLIIRQLCQLLDAVVKIDLDREEGTSFKIVFPSKYDS